MYIYIVVRPFVVWGLYATAFHVLSTMFGGSGSLRRTFVLTGWGFIPWVVTELVFLATTDYVIDQVPEPGPLGLFNYLMQIQNHLLLSVTSALGLVITVWAMPDLLWVYAVKHARNLTTRQAIIVVNVPVGLVVLFTLNDLLQPFI
ncbi:hypothetical protein BRC81_06110 [Halobacteriales archaeon QS_1_68_20]|nr:MAG: hypothetical protein BRC81_06110 [Halobacteriales archaeon QS_1_68_20]